MLSHTAARNFVLLLFTITIRAQPAADLNFLNGNRPVLDAHNCYPYEGRYADRIERALHAGFPIGIEQDLAWRVDPNTGKGVPVVSHAAQTKGMEPTLRDHFFERVRPIIEKELNAGDRSKWPIIVLHFDFKDNQPALLHAVWDLLGEYQGWITTAVKGPDLNQLSPFDPKPLLVLTEEPDAQEEVFYNQVPVGAKLRLFGSAHTQPAQGQSPAEKEHWMATAPVNELVSEPATNYRRWWNSSWHVVEEGGQTRAGDWSSSDSARLHDLVEHAHRLGLWIRFYTFDGFAPAADQGWGSSYNFGSEDAVKLRWKAVLDAGVNLIASDQYEDLRAFMQQQGSGRQLSSSPEPDWPSVERHALELLQQYVRLPSVNPPADTRATAKLISDELRSAGLEVKLYPSAPDGKTNLIARLPGQDRTRKSLVLLNHMDVVPVDATRWKDNPFGASVHDGSIWGRGTLDMKSTGIMQLIALVQLKKLGIVPPTDIVFLSVCDEETGGVMGATWMVEHHWDALNPEYVLDEGGAGSRDVYAPGKLIFGVSVADKQVLWLKLKATGTSGHGSQPIAENANDMLLRAIEKAKEFPPSTKPDPLVNEMKTAAGAFADNKFINAIQKNTMSLTSLRSGVGETPKANVIPSVAEATLDCRLLPGQNEDEFISEIKARINDPHVTVEMISPHPDDPKLSSSETPLFTAVKAAILKQHSDATVMPIVVPFGTDGQKFRMRGVSAYGTIPMVIDAATLGTMHSDSEHIPEDQFRQGLHIYFDILRSKW